MQHAVEAALHRLQPQRAAKDTSTPTRSVIDAKMWAAMDTSAPKRHAADAKIWAAMDNQILADARQLAAQDASQRPTGDSDGQSDKVDSKEKREQEGHETRGWRRRVKERQRQDLDQ